MTPATLEPTPAAQTISDLAVAFQTFNRSSRRLEEAYRQLLARFRQIDRELIETNERLHRKVEELDSLTRYLNDILAGMHSGVVAVDGEGRVTSFNAAAERVLGVSAVEVLGQPHERAFRHADGSLSPLALTLATGRPAADVEREVESGAGTRLRLASSVTPICNAQGQVVGAVEIFSDLTELRELEQRLERADKLAALGEMAAQVAHEIRNPLSSIEGFASLLLRDLPDEDKRRQFAHHIVRGAKSLNKIVTNMLLFCRPFALQPWPISVRAVLEEALAFALEEARHQGRGEPTVERDLDPQADRIEADPDHLRLALMNLLLNASQAMPDGGTIRLSTRLGGGAGTGDEAREPTARGRGAREDGSVPTSKAAEGETGKATPDRRRPETDSGLREPESLDPRPPFGARSATEWVEIRIEDTGPGIPGELRERVLDPFVSTKTRGTGLGLAIVQKIARRHGGRLELASEEGRGTSAMLILPRRVTASAEEPNRGEP